MIKLRNWLIAVLIAVLVASPIVQAQSITAGGVEHFVNGMRISLSSSDPRPSSAQSGTTLYMIPDNSGHPYITLRTSAGSYTKVKKSGTVSVSVGTNYFRVGNVYAYRNSSGKLAIEIDWWDSAGQTTATISGASAAAECVITTSSAHGLNVGDIVGIRNITGTIGTDSSRGINNHLFYVKTVGTSTTATLQGCDTQSLSYTSGGTIIKVPASATTGQTLTDGLLLKTGDLTRRFVCTFMTWGDGDVKDGRSTGRLLSNVDNQEIVESYGTDPADSHTYASTTFRKWNALAVTGQTRLYWVVATPRLVRIQATVNAAGASIHMGYCVTHNRDHAGALTYYPASATFTTATAPLWAMANYINAHMKEWNETESASTNWIQLWEATNGSTATFYGDDGAGVETGEGTFIRVILPR